MVALLGSPIGMDEGSLFVMGAIVQSPLDETLEEELIEIREEYEGEVDDETITELLEMVDSELTPGQEVVKFLCLNYDTINPLLRPRSRDKIVLLGTSPSAKAIAAMEKRKK